MTFDTTYFPPVEEVLAEASLPLGAHASKAHIAPSVGEDEHSPETHKEIDYESLEKARWADEGGANADAARLDDWPDGRGLNSIIESHLRRAQTHFDDNNIDGAVYELIAAAERLKSHHNLVQSSMHTAISYLSTLGCNATPPHPRALSLIRMREQLPS